MTVVSSLLSPLTSELFWHLRAILAHPMSSTGLLIFSVKSARQIGYISLRRTEESWRGKQVTERELLHHLGERLNVPILTTRAGRYTRGWHLTISTNQ